MCNSSTQNIQDNISNLVELLRYRAIHQADKTAYIFLKHGEIEEAVLTYWELDQKVRSIASQIQSLGLTGERALLVYPPSLDYIAAFFGALYAGVIAVPVYPPNPSQPARTLPRLNRILKDAQPLICLTTSTILAAMEPTIEQFPV